MTEESKHRSVRAHAVGTLFFAIFIGLFATALTAKTEESSPSSKKFATAVAPLKAKPIPAYSNIAIEQVRLSDNIVAPPGFPLGELSFVIQPGESVDLVDIFPNDGESGYTFKVRNRSGESGFILSYPVDVTEWIGDRGALLRILTQQPYEYDGDYSTNCSGRAAHIKALEGFISKYSSSQFIAFAELAILATQCYSIPNTLQGVWNELRILKEDAIIGPRETRIKAWSPEVNRLYLTLAQREDERLKELFSFCSLVTKLQGSVPSPVSSLEASRVRRDATLLESSTFGTSDRSARISAEGGAIEVAPASSISGYWVLRPEGQPDALPVTSQQINMEGSRLMISGDGWHGEGEFDGRKGYYFWIFTDGKTGRTEIGLDGEGILHGKVRGSGIDWNYQATREQ